jgi:hypothetical protein
MNAVFGTIGGTLSTAAQTGITSLGTLTALTVDDVAVNGKVITMTGDTSDTIVMTAAANGAFSLVTTDAAGAAGNIQITADGTVDIDSAGVLTLDSGAAINIEPASGSAILLDGTISIDAGVVTGATSITSTAFVGAIDGALGGNTPAAITGTTLQVDYINANASTLTITDSSDTGDLASLAVTTHGATTLTTTDDDATAAHFTLDADGNITLDAATGVVTIEDGGTEVLRFTESCSGDVTVKLVTNAKDLIFTDNGDAEGFRILDAAAGVTTAGAISGATIAGNMRASIAQTDAGTSTALAVTPDALAGSVFGQKTVVLKIIPETTVLTTCHTGLFTVPSTLCGMHLTDADAAVYGVSSSGTPTVQIHNLDNDCGATDMLSTVITIDACERSSYSANTAPVVDTCAAKTVVDTGDRLRIDVDVAGTGTDGLDVILTFEKTT